MGMSAYRYQQRSQVFWHRLIRVEQSGLPATQIAKVLGVSFSKVRKALESPLYKEFKASRVDKRISAFDRELAKNTEAMLDSMRELIPLSLQVYERAMTLGLQDPRFIGPAVKAADSVNDRIGIFSRQSTQVHEMRVPQADLDRAREIAKQLKAKSLELQAPIEVIEDAEIVSEVQVRSPEDQAQVETCTSDSLLLDQKR